MPSLAGLDGPRPLRNIPQPATGTFATAYAESRTYRYDAVVIEGARDLYRARQWPSRTSCRTSTAIPQQ